MRKSKRIVLEDGGIYYGECNKDGLPESLDSSCYWDNDTDEKVSYLGQWVNGKIHGVGTMYYADGRQVYGVWYEGELIYKFKHQKQDSIDVPEQTPNNRPTNNKKIIALLIGNNNYQSEKSLNNCINDVRAIAQKLENIGIDVLKLEDSHKAEMLNAVRWLCEEKSKDYDHVMFYYSGHGASNQGRHYIIATDESNSDTLPVSLEALDAVFSNHFDNVILISDACADIKPGDWNVDPVSRGLNTLISISTSLGNYAFDGIPGGHSPFAYGLLEYIDEEMTILEILEEANKLTCAIAYKYLNMVQTPELYHAVYYPKDFSLF